MGAFAAVAGLIGTGMKAYGSLEAGRQEEKAFRQRASVLEADALATEKAAREEERALRLKGKRIGAQQLVDFQGLGGLLVMAETRSEIAKEASYISEEGLRTGSRFRSQAGFEREMGASARRAGMWQAGTSLLTGGSKFITAGEESKWWSKPKLKSTFRGKYPG